MNQYLLELETCETNSNMNYLKDKVVINLLSYFKKLKVYKHIVMAKKAVNQVRLGQIRLGLVA